MWRGQLGLPKEGENMKYSMALTMIGEQIADAAKQMDILCSRVSDCAEQKSDLEAIFTDALLSEIRKSQTLHTALLAVLMDRHKQA